MTSKEKLVYAIIKFLQRECTEGQLGEDVTESIEVAKQCLETAYGIDLNKTELDIGESLDDLVARAGSNSNAQADVTPEMKAQAEDLKTQGNDFMKQDLYQDAVNSYSKALELDPHNAIYYSNRAAAFNKLEKYDEAILDCDEAIRLDPSYSKAYGRKGLALSGLNCHQDAIECYKKAIELDPGNQNFKTNLEIAQEKAKTTSGVPGPGGFSSLLGGGPGGMPDLSSFLNNPAMMNMAQQFMRNPGVQQMMTNMMSSGQQADSGQTGPPGPPGPPGAGFEQLLRVGQQMAEQMQQTNPELVEQLRNEFQGGGGTGQQPPPSGS